MNKKELKKRLLWQCRRGMLELDILLKRFIEHHFDELDPPQVAAFERLLQYQDDQLFRWFMRDGTCDDAGVQQMIDQITA
tara:strand:+ start:745 stop:984 length:240 start_codon:yes stop_codon:yes gene_type:complete